MARVVNAPGIPAAKGHWVIVRITPAIGDDCGIVASVGQDVTLVQANDKAWFDCPFAMGQSGEVPMYEHMVRHNGNTYVAVKDTDIMGVVP